MKDYINVFHGIISEIHFWEKMEFDKKKDCLTKFLQNFENLSSLVDYFDEFSNELKRNNLNSYLKSVNNK